MKKYVTPELMLQNIEPSDIITISGLRMFRGFSTTGDSYMGDELDISGI